MIHDIQLQTYKFDELLTIDEAVSLLNRYLTKMQEEKKTILSTKHEGKNLFLVEYRQGD